MENKKSKATRILKWVTGGLESIIGFPIIGGAIVISLMWTPLLLMLALHIVSLVLSSREQGRKKTGHILGIIASCLGWIPFVGMVMHILTAIFLMMEAGKDE
ncbi:hypothetical protein [Sporosarcina sp. G11-34]|uniref:hypothetical protein n=1 Tax=Sporosarcina sp. G11-34 TaxID=2849605 RepID=UPI0022A9B0BC|nr:hypothetical protein [Sporosarcina sp. G11-34]MCZ2259858.1 hypothetical protein [Sporosarcina sp. G11-34]